MAIERYFEKFPVITYANNQAIDITKRVSLLDRVSTNPYVFYPYEITSEERADQLSYRYYNDPYRSWLLYLTNKIVDPYYEWYLNNQEFEDFVIKKYGSSVSAQQKVKHYRSNWVSSAEQSISQSEWNALTVSQQQYWEPIFNPDNTIKSYQRKQRDLSHVTNKIVSYAINANAFELKSFITDEIVTVVFDNQNSGNGQVLKVDTNTGILYLQHMRGSFIDNDEVFITGNSYVYSTESNVNVALIDVTLLANNIPTDEEMYWESVSYYDFENEKNEYNKTIRIMDSDLKDVAAENLNNLMKENF